MAPSLPAPGSSLLFEDPPVEIKPLKALVIASQKRTRDMFTSNHGQRVPTDDASEKIKIHTKIRDEYAALDVFNLPEPGTKAAATATWAASTASEDTLAEAAVPSGSRVESRSATAKIIDAMPKVKDADIEATQQRATTLALHNGSAAALSKSGGSQEDYKPSAAVARRMPSKWPRPVWHAPWKLYRVISGHLGWVRSLAFDHGNEWFVTGSADRTIKVWDTASGQLKLTLTGHIEQVTGLAVSARHPYMFSGSLDKEVKCWDLEYNKVIRQYHGHLSGIYSLALHPTLDVLVTGGRDSVARVWDMRTKVQVHCLSGHDETVASILCQGTDPQIITGSHDKTIKMWDLRKGKTMSTLTYHKKSIRSMAAHPQEYSFAAGSADNIKKYRLPQGEFLHNTLQEPRTIVNALAINQDNVMMSGGDNGSLWGYDWKSGNRFQAGISPVQPGSLDSESGIFALAFDKSGSRLASAEADKTIKMWKEDDSATPETHPINFRPPRDIKRF